MITDTFENLSEEIIKVSCNDNAVKVDACILTFSHVILKYVLDNFVWTDNLELIAQKLQKISKTLNGRTESELAEKLLNE